MIPSHPPTTSVTTDSVSKAPTPIPRGLIRHPTIQIPLHPQPITDASPSEILANFETMIRAPRRL